MKQSSLKSYNNVKLISDDNGILLINNDEFAYNFLNCGGKE